jgi:integrase
MPSKKAAAAQGNVFARLKVQLEDGREVTLFELVWKDCTPLVASLYRNARTLETSGRKDRHGAPAHISDSTANRELTTLQSMFTYHRDVSKKIGHNPLDGFQRTDETQNARQTALTPEQMDAFLSAAHPMYQDIVRVAYRAAGMRKGEVQRLLKSEVDWEARLIRLPAGRNKNRKPRTIPYPDDVDRILRHHAAISRSQYVFVSPRDPKRCAPVTDSAMWYWLDQARRRSGMKGFDDEPIVTHTARHSAATALMEIGTPERLIRGAMGMSPKTFERYAQFKRDQQEVLRGFQNRSVTPPTPIAGELEGERRPASASGYSPRLVSKSET